MSKTIFICQKCGKEIIIETDLIKPDDVKAEDKAKKLHECKEKK